MADTEQIEVQRLWQASQSGDTDAFMLLVGRFESAVCAIALAHTGNEARAEELAQDAFLEAWKRIRTVREPARIGAWFCAIARNLSRKALRRRGPEALDPEVLAADDDPERSLSQHQQHTLLWAALSALPDTYREPLVLYYRHERSGQEVADALGLTAATVDQRLSRGRRMLREEVQRALEPALGRRDPAAKDRLRRRVASLLPAVGPSLGPSMVTPTLLGGLAMKKLAIAAVAIIALLAAYLLHDASTPSASPGAASASTPSPSSDRARVGALASSRPHQGLQRARERLRHDEDEPGEEGEGTSAFPAYETTRNGNRVTVNLDGGPSRVVLFKGEGGSFSFYTPASDSKEDVDHYQHLMKVAREAHPQERPELPHQISGRVVTDDGAPVPGAVVLAGTMLTFSENELESHASAESGTQTDAAGGFTLDVPDQASIVAMSPAGWSDVEHISAQTSTVELRISDGHRLRGRTLRDGVGEPATVAVVDDTGSVAFRTESDLSGTFEVFPLSAGSYTVRAVVEDGREAGMSRVGAAEVVVGEAPISTVDVELPTGALLAVALDLESPIDVDRGATLTRILPGHRCGADGRLRGPESEDQSGDLSHLLRPGDLETLLEPQEFRDMAPGPFTASVLMTGPMTPQAGDGDEVVLAADDLGFGCVQGEIGEDQDLVEVRVAVRAAAAP